MAEVIRMPRMSDTMEEGVIVGWLKEVGDKVEPGDVLAEVETDKATMELESFQEGYLLYIGVREGAVPVDGLLAIIGEKDEDYAALLESAKESNGSADDSDVKAVEPDQPAADEDGQSEPASESTSDPDGRIKASPLAKSMAMEAGIDLRQVQGSGDQGRIVKRDIEAYMQDPAKAKKAPVQVPAGEESFEEVTVSQMRKTIARRLVESKFSAPHFYLTIEINMAQAVADRKQINETSETRISFNDFIVKACAMAIRQHPAINASWQGNTIRKNHHIHVGVAVAVEDGLLVPVLKHADTMSLSTINGQVKALAEKARNKKLQPEEMQGNTFTISNLGMYGIEEFTAIINPPDACILAVGGIIKKPVVVQDEIRVAPMMKVTLSCDHRVVDGATGAQFLQTLKSMLENPVRMLV